MAESGSAGRPTRPSGGAPQPPSSGLEIHEGLPDAEFLRITQSVRNRSAATGGRFVGIRPGSLSQVSLRRSEECVRVLQVAGVVAGQFENPGIGQPFVEDGDDPLEPRLAALRAPRASASSPAPDGPGRTR